MVTALLRLGDRYYPASWNTASTAGPLLFDRLLFDCSASAGASLTTLCGGFGVFASKSATQAFGIRPRSLTG